MISIPCFFFVISLGTYIAIKYYDSNKDMERYYYNHDKTKYNMLIYATHILFFVAIYNFREVAIQYLIPKKYASKL